VQLAFLQLGKNSNISEVTDTMRKEEKNAVIRIGCSIPIGVVICIIGCMIAKFCNVPTLAIELFIILPSSIMLIISLMLIYGIVFDRGDEESPFI